MPKKHKCFNIFDPHATVEGHTIADWTAEWWNWAFEAPASKNPFTDPTGAFQNINNDEPVFFLAGTFGGSETRGANDPIDVPEGTPVLFPLINGLSTPALFSEGFQQPGESDRHAVDREIAEFTAIVTDPARSKIFASIDGIAIPEKELRAHFEVTDFFSMGPVEVGSVAHKVFHLTPGTPLEPAKAAGYWLMAELSNQDCNGSDPGDHTLTFGGAIPGFSTSVTAYIDIV
jgi:hypothetical protein